MGGIDDSQFLNVDEEDIVKGWILWILCRDGYCGYCEGMDIVDIV